MEIIIEPNTKNEERILIRNEDMRINPDGTCTLINCNRNIE